MDVYFTEEARRRLEILAKLASRSGGLLIGHRRGPRYVIESFLPLPPGTAPSIEERLETESRLDGEWVGEFYLGATEDDERSMLSPAKTGKILLEIQKQPKGEIRFRARRVEYEDRFYLKDIDIFNSRTGEE